MVCKHDVAGAIQDLPFAMKPLGPLAEQVGRHHAHLHCQGKGGGVGGGQATPSRHILRTVGQDVGGTAQHA